MSIQVLIATMNQKNHSLLDQMNIQSDAIVANQCDRNEIEEFEYNGHKIKYLSFSERGVGLNRNNALMRANSEICLIADDDIILENNYASIIDESFSENPEADVIIFNLRENSQERFIIKKKFRVRFYNYMRFGATRICFRTKSITRNGITFNLHFGGGAEFSNGEDTLFLHDCLKKKLKVIAIPQYIASLVESRKSTWFEGYIDKFFLDRGTLFYYLSKKFAWLLCLQFCLRHKNTFKGDKTWWEAFKLMLNGIRNVKG